MPRKAYSSRKFWTKAELKILVEHYPTGGVPLVNSKLDKAGFGIRTYGSVRSKARLLDLPYDLLTRNPELAKIVKEEYPYGGSGPVLRRLALENLPSYDHGKIQRVAKLLGIKVLDQSEIRKALEER